jgi:hypothetical protein
MWPPMDVPEQASLPIRSRPRNMKAKRRRMAAFR